MYWLQIPQFWWMHYLKVIPWPNMPENLINSVKSNLWSFRSSNLWYSLESYFYKHKNIVELQQFIASSKQEWLSYSMNFFQKLYWWRVNFSIAVPQKLIQQEKYPYQSKIGLLNHWVLQTRRVWAVGWDDFASSSSILAWIFQEVSPFITEKGIIKSTFSFTKWDYSLLIKERLFRKNTKSMNDQDKQKFYEAFPPGMEVFLFRWDIERNMNSTKIQAIIEKNLSLYSSPINSYVLLNNNSIFNTIPWRKRLMSSEWLLSHWLFVPVSTYWEIQTEPIIIPGNDLYKGWFVYLD